MDINLLIGLIGGLGIGTLINTVVSYILQQKKDKKKSLYKEKKEVYVNLLLSISDTARKPSKEASNKYALWQIHCTLFGSEDVAKYSQLMIDTNDDPIERSKVFDNLIKAIKNDLEMHL